MAHRHSVYDTDIHFTIDSITRAIVKQPVGKITLSQYDHNSERFTFEIARYIDGHDMLACDKVEIHYINISANKNTYNADVYLCEDVQVSPEDENIVIFSWLVSQNATKYEGALSFVIRFVCLTGETLDYAWSTPVYKPINIVGSYDNAYSSATDYSDILEQWKRTIDGNLIKDIYQTRESTESEGVNELEVTLNNGKRFLLKVRNGKAGDISRIEKTNSAGLTDTYTIYFTNGSTSTFTVKNGADGIPFSDVTVDDAGTVLAVNEYGEWQLADPLSALKKTQAVFKVKPSNVVGEVPDYINWNPLSATRYKVEIKKSALGGLFNPYIADCIVEYIDETGTSRDKAILDMIELINGDIVIYSNIEIDCKIIIKGDYQ